MVMVMMTMIDDDDGWMVQVLLQQGINNIGAHDSRHNIEHQQRWAVVLMVDGWMVMLCAFSGCRFNLERLDIYKFELG